MAGQGTPPLQVTLTGFVGGTLDALMLFEACLQGILNHVPRRPHDREREELITSGAIFIYEEHSSGIKRWTDGYNWSPSRILSNFLIYRELEGPFPPGEKKRARKPAKKNGSTSSRTAAEALRAAPMMASPAVPLVPSPHGVVSGAFDSSEQQRIETERQLVGSLVDSYPFKTDGLVKKTISITYNGVSHHLVSYYNVNDVLSKKLPFASEHHLLAGVVPRPELMRQTTFRNQVTVQDPVYVNQVSWARHNNIPYTPMPHEEHPAYSALPPPGSRGAMMAHSQIMSGEMYGHPQHQPYPGAVYNVPPHHLPQPMASDIAPNMFPSNAHYDTHNSNPYSGFESQHPESTTSRGGRSSLVGPVNGTDFLDAHGLAMMNPARRHSQVPPSAGYDPALTTIDDVAHQPRIMPNDDEQYFDDRELSSSVPTTAPGGYHHHGGQILSSDPFAMGDEGRAQSHNQGLVHGGWPVAHDLTHMTHKTDPEEHLGGIDDRFHSGIGIGEFHANAPLKQEEFAHAPMPIRRHQSHHVHDPGHAHNFFPDRT